MQNKIAYYQRILKNNKNADFWTPAEQLLKAENLSGCDKTLYDTTVCVTAPVLINYVLWVLANAQKKQIKRLYFLARDGYIMKQIAEILCKYNHCDIECRYFYCSRFSLRMPLYYINQKEALDKFCINGYYITPEVIMERAGLNKGDAEKVLSDIHIGDQKEVLSEAGLHEIRLRLENSQIFSQIISEKSEKAYDIVYKYFQQEGLFDGKSFAIVDTGWTGSMQRSIRQIMEFSGYKKTQIGYYFGMFEKGKAEDGIYNCYYFSPQKHYLRCAIFNNNLFECMCSANHGMTIGYKYDSVNHIIPCFKENKQYWNIDLQIKATVLYTKKFAEMNKTLLKQTNNEKMVEKLLKIFMGNPSYAEAEMYGNILFCDDLTESYMLCLSEKLCKKDLRQQMVFSKVFNKLFIKKKVKKYKESFWVNGTIALYKYSYKKFWLWNMNFSNYIKYIRIYLKGR